MLIFKNYSKIGRFFILLLDLIITLFSFLLAIFVRDLLRKIGPFGIDASFSEQYMIIILVMGLWWILFSIDDLYTPHRFSSFKSECTIVLKSILRGSVILLVLGFLFKYYFPRSLILLFAVINLLMLLGEKYLVYLFVTYARRKNSNLKSVVVVGAGDRAREFVDSVHKYPDWGMTIIGFIDHNADRIGQRFCGATILGTHKNLAQILKDNVVDEVIFALPPKYLGEIEELLKICEVQGVEARIISDFFKLMIAKTKVDQIHGIPMVTFSTKPHDDLQLFLKRILDIVGSFIIIIALAPLFLLITIAIKLTSPGPVLYPWNVVGLNKNRFKSYKFRTMVANADKLKQELLSKNEMTGVAFKMKDDPRITKVGGFLRKYSLDELPQLFSVLKGDMSLVGPRPPLVTEVMEYDYWHRRKLSVKPGLTCLWQVNGRNAITDFDDWMRLDLEYIDNWSLWLDCKILLKTIPAVLRGTGR
jgi:exopolysaccharide biosynthesis polyprenyl glycosylphosphotransferase